MSSFIFKALYILPKSSNLLYTKIENLQKVKNFLEKKNIKTESAEIEYVAKELVELNNQEKEKIEKFVEELENYEDFSDYYTNIIGF